jgi:hypothetical protein
LSKISQGETEPFTSFYPRFEKKISNAQAENWPNDSKISYLWNALNDKMKAALVFISTSEIDTYIKLAGKCEKLSNRMDLFGQWKRNRIQYQNRYQPAISQNQPRKVDIMEWEPTEQESTKINAIRRSPANVNGYPFKRPENQALKGKRAKWVEKSEINKRRIKGKYLRCGRNNCRIDRCPLATAIPSAY